MTGNFALFIARVVCRLSGAVLRLFGHAGTSLPGRLALRLCPDILERMSAGTESVIVTGTNGKTTTCALLRRMADALGAECVSNASGANLVSGIAATFASQPFGKRRATIAVIECDEANLPAAAAAIHPRAIVVTNLFRDQLDRYGEITGTRDRLLEGIKNAPEATLCLNADCSLTATLAQETQNPALYFSAEVESAGAPAVSDAPRCLVCGGAYEYESRTFAHLGKWYCPNCGRKRPAPDVTVAPGEERCALSATVRGEELALSSTLHSDYELYNIAAALTAASAMGWDIEKAAASLADAAAPFGRGETITIGKTPVRLFLAKNPAGMDRLLKRLSDETEPYYPVFCLNDNYADGRDVSWIWDCSFEDFVRLGGAKESAVWGTRRHDMRLRLEYASEKKGGVAVREIEKLEELKRLIAFSDVPVCIVANYTSMLAVRGALIGKRIGGA